MNDEILKGSCFHCEEVALRNIELEKEVKSLRLILMSHGEVIDMNYELKKELKELRGHNSTIFHAGYEAGALDQSKGSCFQCEEVTLRDVRLGRSEG